MSEPSVPGDIVGPRDDDPSAPVSHLTRVLSSADLFLGNLSLQFSDLLLVGSLGDALSWGNDLLEGLDLLKVLLLGDLFGPPLPVELHLPVLVLSADSSLEALNSPGVSQSALSKLPLQFPDLSQAGASACTSSWSSRSSSPHHSSSSGNSSARNGAAFGPSLSLVSGVAPDATLPTTWVSAVVEVETGLWIFAWFVAVLVWRLLVPWHAGVTSHGLVLSASVSHALGA